MAKLTCHKCLKVTLKHTNKFPCNIYCDTVEVNKLQYKLQSFYGMSPHLAQSDPIHTPHVSENETNLPYLNPHLKLDSKRKCHVIFIIYVQNSQKRFPSCLSDTFYKLKFLQIIQLRHNIIYNQKE
jgi:hypothetical protein